MRNFTVVCLCEDAVWHSIKSGVWCPHCYGRYIYLSDLQNFVKKYEGQCLSTEYINAKTRYQWKCKNNHIWQDTWSNVKFGRWCSRCNVGVIK